MKLRIRENTIRLRLSKSEMDAFFENGRYSQFVDFGNITFRYTLESSTDVNDLEAHYSANEIKILIPVNLCGEWQNSDIVGYSAEFISENQKSIFIKVEKDFVCLDETDEDQSDNYPNPRMS